MLTIPTNSESYRVNMIINKYGYKGGGGDLPLVYVSAPDSDQY